ncbi:MAG: pitrilysin family protein [Candidatus Caldipriscus sp.]|nr:pitrilysin family protein [Candidatus Caldipriscus sp.]
MKRFLPFLIFLSCATTEKKEEEVMVKEAKPITVSEIKVVEKTLPNGLHILAAKKDKLPIFHMEIVIKAGSVLDPEGKEGLANLVGSLVDEGTKTKNSTQIAEYLESLGANFEVSVGKTQTTITARSLTSDADNLLDIVSEIITSPTFPEKEFQREKSRQIASIKNDLSNPNYVTSIKLDALIYEGTPLAHPTDGYVESVEKITREDVVNFHKNYWLPNLSYIVVVSDLEPEEAIGKVEKYFSGWQRKDVSLPDIPQISAKKKVEIFHMDGINQAYIRLAFPVNITRNSPDYNKVRVANYILGGSGFSSRILKKIRVEKGYAYSAYSYVMPNIVWKDGKYPSIFIAGLQTRVETSEDATNTLIELIKEAKEKGFTQEELDAAKGFYNGYIARLSETYSQVANLLSTRYLYGLPNMFWIKDIEEIRNLSLEDINGAAKKYIDVENFVLLIVTDTTKAKIKNLKI